MTARYGGSVEGLAHGIELWYILGRLTALVGQCIQCRQHIRSDRRVFELYRGFSLGHSSAEG